MVRYYRSVKQAGSTRSMAKWPAPSGWHQPGGGPSAATPSRPRDLPAVSGAAEWLSRRRLRTRGGVGRGASRRYRTERRPAGRTSSSPYLRPDRPGGSGRVEAYNPECRRGHLKDFDSDAGIGLFQVHAMGSRLSPERDPDSPRNRRKRRPRNGRSTHESTVAAHPDGNLTSDQVVGGSNPSGRATPTRERALADAISGR